MITDLKSAGTATPDLVYIVRSKYFLCSIWNLKEIPSFLHNYKTHLIQNIMDTEELRNLRIIDGDDSPAAFDEDDVMDAGDDFTEYEDDFEDFEEEEDFEDFDDGDEF
jgi:hypothetical protein